MRNVEVEVGESKLSSKSSIVVPKAVRRVLDAKPGDYLVWILKNGEVVLRKK